MLVKQTTTVKSFKNTNTQRFGGWGEYFKLFKQALKMFKETPSKFGRFQSFRIKTVLFFQCLFKPFKQFYHTVSVSTGDVAKTYRNEELVSFFRKSECTKRTKHYLFSVLFLISSRELTDEELQEITKE